MEIIIVLGVIALVVLFFVAQYNRLIRLNISVDEAWAQIEVQLKRRADLIPNLVETVKGYAKHEQSTFDAVVTARAKQQLPAQLQTLLQPMECSHKHFVDYLQLLRLTLI